MPGPPDIEYEPPSECPLGGIVPPSQAAFPALGITKGWMAAEPWLCRSSVMEAFEEDFVRSFPRRGLEPGCDAVVRIAGDRHLSPP
jgi:hypothetical protein